MHILHNLADVLFCIICLPPIPSSDISQMFAVGCMSLPLGGPLVHNSVLNCHGLPHYWWNIYYNSPPLFFVYIISFFISCFKGVYLYLIHEVCSLCVDLTWRASPSCSPLGWTFLCIGALVCHYLSLLYHSLRVAYFWSYTLTEFIFDGGASNMQHFLLMYA